MSNSIEDELAMLVGAERDRPEAGVEAADRVWSGVQARLDGAPPPASVPPGTPWGILSLVGGAVVVVGLVGGGWALSRPVEPVHFEPLPPAPVLSVVADQPVIPELQIELPKAGIAPESQPEAEPEKAPAKAKRKNAGSVADELALIERARTSLDRGQAGAALGVLETHRRQFPKGAFREEAAALRASALCKSGKTDAAHKASVAFLRRYPNSVHASRVKACAD